MNVIGIDIGTSKISLIVYNGEQILYKDSRKNVFCFKKQQDCNEIIDKCLQMISGAEKNYFIEKIGISNEMHGVLYVDKEGNAVSNLYTWQDESGNLEYKNGLTYAKYMTEKTGYEMATGFGLTTHFYLKETNKIPQNAYKICTIGDYLAIKLAKRAEIKMHVSNAASLGLYDVQNNRFDQVALSALGIDGAILPKVFSDFDYDEKLTLAIGDNQASYYGCVDDIENSVLINIGTGSQISVGISGYKKVQGMETRPLDEKRYLLVGSAICGGYAYSILSDFFSSVIDMCGMKPEKPMYEYMDYLMQNYSGESVDFNTTFKGTRENPNQKAAITNISQDNFTAGSLIDGLMNGMVNELYKKYEYLIEQDIKRTLLIGSGNGIRRNKVLKNKFEKVFATDMILSQSEEEASVGVAKLALKK